MSAVIGGTTARIIPIRPLMKTSPGAERNYTGYGNRELEQDFDRQSMEPDPEKRKHLVREIDRKLREDGARPMTYPNRAARCRYPQVKGFA